MTKTSYTAYAIKPEEIIRCVALDAANYPAEYAERVDKIVADIKDDSLKAKVKQTLGCFEKGSAGNLIQSSPYRLVVLEQLFPEGKVLASRPRLQIARENDPNFMSGFYVDCGLNLVPLTDMREDSIINPIQAGELEADLRNTGVDIKYAKLIPFRILTSEVNDKSPSGLVFKLSEEGKDTSKRTILNTKDFQWNYQPSQSGLFGAGLDGGGGWGCGYWYLDGSYKDGGVVVESADGTAKNFEAYTPS